MVKRLHVSLFRPNFPQVYWTRQWQRGRVVEVSIGGLDAESHMLINLVVRMP
jgi:hypothetical protein